MMSIEKKQFSDFEIEEKTSGGAVYEAGVRESKRSKAVRQIAQPLMDKYWKQPWQELEEMPRNGNNVASKRRDTIKNE